MKIKRKFTTAGADVYGTVQWTQRSSRISNPDGSVVFEMKDAQVPADWSQLATDIVVSKYFRKAGVPQTDAPPCCQESPAHVAGSVVQNRHSIFPVDGL